MLDGRGAVIRINLHDIIGPPALGFQDPQCLIGIAGGNDAVGNLALENQGSLFVAHIGQGRKITVGRHAVRAACHGVCAGKRGKLQIVYKIDFPHGVGKLYPHGGSGRADMLKRSRRRQAGRLFQFRDQLPAVECIQKIDIARSAVQHTDRKLPAVLHENAGGFLVWIAAIFERQFICH